MASHTALLQLQQAESSTDVQPQVPGSFCETARSYYGLLGVERNKYINISELLSLDLSRLVPLNISVIKSDVALQRQRTRLSRPRIPLISLSIDTLERRHGLALVFIEGVSNDASVFDINVWRGNIVLPRQCVFHPLIVVTLWAHVRSASR
jgi:hypothetical protein